MQQRATQLLERTRRRTLDLIEPLTEDALNAVHDPLMSPIVWDLGHIANFEELWIVQNAGGQRPLREELGTIYDPFTAPRRERGGLAYLSSEECFAYMEAVRERSLACIEQADLSDETNPLRARGYVYDLVARHEQQHSETILQTLQIMTTERYEPERSIQFPAAGETSSEMLLVEGGPFEMGASPDWFAYDNERPQHVRELGSFWIDALPVTNGQMREFIEDGGYERRELWSEPGWQWKQTGRVKLPRYWHEERGNFFVRSFGTVEPMDAGLPVCHLSWYEADAYARYAGKRLPSEAEWEKAASWDEASGTKHRYPWGDERPSTAMANLDQLAFGTAPAGSYASYPSPYGAQQLMGDVWEWTSSGFDAFEGFRPFPYPEYSEPFLGGPFKVLKGGSWATQPGAVTTAFRNWDYPERRQIFAGFRCAQDAEPAGDERGS
jgi:gamma-glutamyl hercynylcysteine S-oxide synthase